MLYNYIPLPAYCILGINYGILVSMGLLIPNEIATRWLSEHAIITLMLMLYSQCCISIEVVSLLRLQN